VCAPDGQVRIDGEIWAARCAEGCGAGEAVTVTGVEGLTLVVERARPPTIHVPESG
jgi:membrane protein implicated in regulation of membrane protease activity